MRFYGTPFHPYPIVAMITNHNDENYGPSENGVWYERTCILDGKKYRHELPLCVQLFQLGLDQLRKEMIIQDAFPGLSSEDREFILSGITPQRWNELFPPPPPLDEVTMSQILNELESVITQLFGNNDTKPFNLDGLTAEAVRDYPDLDESAYNQARQWVTDWVEKKGLVKPTVNPSLK